MANEPLVPAARLIHLPDDTVQAETTNILAYAYSGTVGKVATISVTVPLGDPGQSADTSHGFAQALLSGGALLLEFSLSGLGGFAPLDPTKPGLNPGTGYVDFRRYVEAPVQTLSQQDITLTERGESLWILYATMPAGKGAVLFSGVSLRDCLTANNNSVIPLTAGGTGGVPFLSPGANGTIPYLQGVMRKGPGLPTWAGSPRLTYGVAINSGLAAQPTYIDSRSDYVSRLVQTAVDRAAGLYIPGDPVGLGNRATLVDDSSDPLLNLAQYV